MYRLLSLCPLVLLLAACAHQPGSQVADSKRSERDLNDERYQSRQQQDEEARCQAISPSAGTTSSGQPMAVTDCDVMAADRAAKQQTQRLNEATPTDPSRGFDSFEMPQLPASQRLGL